MSKRHTVAQHCRCMQSFGDSGMVQCVCIDFLSWVDSGGQAHFPTVSCPQ